MEKRQQLYEGKAKKVFATDDPDFLIVRYKDDAPPSTALSAAPSRARASSTTA